MNPSPVHRALVKATERVKGSVKPYSIMGSLPLVKDLQRNGFDVQLIGFGLRYVRILHVPPKHAHAHPII